MISAMAWLVWTPALVLLGVAAAIAILAAIPVSAEVAVASAPRPRWRLAVSVLDGRLSLPPLESGAAKASQRVRPRTPKPRRSAPARARATADRRVETARAGLVLLERFAHRVQIVALHVEGQFGFADPADTGAVYGALTPLLTATPRPGWMRVCVTPDFHHAGVSGSAALRLRARPIALVPPVFMFIARMIATWR